MIVVVSDVHLAKEKMTSNKLGRTDQDFLDFLGLLRTSYLKSGDNLVLLGDLIDFWKRDFSLALKECNDIFSELMNFDGGVKMHYVVGNHDYYMLNLKDNLKSGGLHFSEVEKSVRLSSGGKNFFFIHGYQLETLANPYYKSQTAYELFAENLCLAGDDAGNAAQRLWDMYRKYKDLSSILQNLKRLPSDIDEALKSMMLTPDARLTGKNKAASLIEVLAKLEARTVYLGMERDEILVYGHTHRQPACFDPKTRVVNTGSWKKLPCDYYSFVQIDQGAINLKEFKNGEILNRNSEGC
jgi:UDP-2,3-diacylglucosamine pyrophosphatase LpxH